jgi:DNA-binding beta-propeller fold protein YncE
MKPFRPVRILVLSTALAAALLAGAGSALFGVCGPFTDVSDAAFCPFVLEVFYMGITTGTTPTTYDPTGAVNRLQMAAFLSRSVDGVLKRGGNRRAPLNQFWTTQQLGSYGLTTVGSNPQEALADGADIWVTNGGGGGTVSRIRASDGKLLETWTGAGAAAAVLVALGQVFVTGASPPNSLYLIDPSQAAGAVTTVATGLGTFPTGIAFDGLRIWTSNAGGSVSIVTPGSWTVATATTGFSEPRHILYDGANMWAIDRTPHTLLKLDGNGAILQTVTIGNNPGRPAFDGTNIWTPTLTTVAVVRAATGAVLATLTGNGLADPQAAAFDGQRIMVVNYAVGSGTVSLWKAADLSPLGFFPLGQSTGPTSVCSDGINFWITLQLQNKLARF